MRVVGYARASKEEQKLTPQYQAEELERWCADNDAQLVSVFTDAGVSGTAEIDKRPGLLDALHAVKAERADVFLVYRRDRFARNVRISTSTQYLIQKMGAAVVCVEGGGNGDSPEAQLMGVIADAFAAYEVLVIAMRTRAALQYKKGKGERVGSIPFGYRLKLDGQHSKKCEVRVDSRCKGCLSIQLDAKESAIVEKLQGLRDRGLSWRNVADTAKQAGIVNRVGNPFHFTHVRKIVMRDETTLTVP